MYADEVINKPWTLDEIDKFRQALLRCKTRAMDMARRAVTERDEGLMEAATSMLWVVSISLEQLDQFEEKLRQELTSKPLHKENEGEHTYVLPPFRKRRTSSHPSPNSRPADPC